MSYIAVIHLNKKQFGASSCEKRCYFMNLIDSKKKIDFKLN